MAKNTADSASEKSSGLSEEISDPSEELVPIDSDGDFDNEEEVAPPRANQKDPSIRRKIEDMLERRRLREELGIYDDDAWDGF